MASTRSRRRRRAVHGRESQGEEAFSPFHPNPCVHGGKSVAEQAVPRVRPPGEGGYMGCTGEV